MATVVASEEAGAAAPANRFLQALTAGQWMTAYGQLSGVARSGNTGSWVRFRQFIRQDPVLRDAVTFRVATVEYRGARLVVKAEVTNPEGRTGRVVFLLEEEPAGWGIVAVESGTVFP